jgi:toxin ParE1/3/4
MTNYHNFRLTPDAQADLFEIRHYTVDHWGGIQSKKYLSDLRQTIKLLAETPKIGKQHPNIGPDIFSFPNVSHLIYYTLDEQQLIVFAILHKSMVPFNHLGERDIS